MEAAAAGERVIIFSGLPGTGKSTMAEHVARTMRIPAFASDWLMGGLKPAHAALSKLDRSQYIAACDGLIGTLVTRQLMLAQSAIVDGLMRDDEIPAWRETAASFSARLFLIECVCSDQAIHRSRIEGRVRGIPGWHEIGWDHVERMRAEYPPLTVNRLVIDAIEPLSDNTRLVLDHIST